jgi:hypothetical protein
MAEKKQARKSDTPSGAGSSAGAPVVPTPDSGRPEKEEPAPVQSIPIGVPVDAREFERLKAEAERPTEHEGEATEDPPEPPEES